MPFGAFLSTFGSQTTPKCSKIAQTGCLRPFWAHLRYFLRFFAILGLLLFWPKGSPSPPPPLNSDLRPTMCPSRDLKLAALMQNSYKYFIVTYGYRAAKGAFTLSSKVDARRVCSARIWQVRAEQSGNIGLFARRANLSLKLVTLLDSANAP
jgi:hypothetical protein